MPDDDTNSIIVASYREPLLAAHILFFRKNTRLRLPPPFVLVTHAMPTSLLPPPPKGRQIISSPAAWNGAAARTNTNS